MTRKRGKQQVKVNRNYKARLFEMIYRDKKELLELYNAVNGTEYDNPNELEINTLENAIYLSMHNDVSFVIDSRLSLYEHQSTYSPNLPLRFLMYVSDLYSKITKDANLYSSKLVTIPPPKFIVFYNGEAKRPEMEEMKLSDAFLIEDSDPSLELRAVVLNINPGYNEKLLNTCKTLKDYVEYTSRVRLYAEEMYIEDAVEKAIEECIKQGILSEFLMAFRMEAKKMSIYEYDEERQRRFDKEEGRELGREAKLSEIVEEMLKDNISIPVIAKYCKEPEEVINKIVCDAKRKKNDGLVTNKLDSRLIHGLMTETKIGQVLVNQGIERGKTDQIRKKLAKGKSVSEIADALEETEESIMELIQKYNL